MGRKVLYPAVFVLLALMATPAVAATEGDFGMADFWTINMGGYDGRIYENDGTTLVAEGAMAQFIVGRDGASIVDPLEYFDANDSGTIEGAELAAVTTWVNNGADPSEISGGSNKLLAAGTMPGYVGLAAPGDLDWNYEDEGYDDPPLVDWGVGLDYLAIRFWNLSYDEMGDFCTVPLQELWYFTDREMSTYEGYTLDYPGRDNGLFVGGGGIPEGDYPGDYEWTYGAVIGTDVYAGAKTKNVLTTNLGTCPIPEPGTMLLIGSAALLLLVRRKK